MMVVPRPRQARSRIIEPGDDVDIVAERRERRETRRQLKIRARGRRNPVTLGDAVAVKPKEEPGFWPGGGSSARDIGCVERAVWIKHGLKRRQRDGRRHALQ